MMVSRKNFVDIYDLKLYHPYFVYRSDEYLKSDLIVPISIGKLPGGGANGIVLGDYLSYRVLPKEPKYFPKNLKIIHNIPVKTYQLFEGPGYIYGKGLVYDLHWIAERVLVEYDVVKSSVGFFKLEP